MVYLKLHLPRFGPVSCKYKPRPSQVFLPIGNWVILVFVNVIAPSTLAHNPAHKVSWYKVHCSEVACLA